MHPTLLIIDMQKAFLQGKLPKEKIAEACEHINYVADLLRKHGHPVVLIKDMESATEANAAEFEIIDEIDRKEGDRVVEKIYSNAFWKTDLEKQLAAEKVDLVIVCGFAAEHCVLFTYNGAKERGFKTVMLQNGMLSTDDAAMEAITKSRNLVSYPVVEAMVGEVD